LITVIKL